MSRITVNGSTLTVKNVPDEVHAALESAGDSKSEAVRDILSDWHENHSDESPDAYYPADPHLNSVYSAAWDLCNDDLILSMYRHGSRIRQRVQIDEKGLKASLMDLQDSGYVSRTPVWPGASVGKDGMAESYRIKPPAADPEQWVYRR